MIQQNIFGGDLGGPVGPKAKLGYFYVNYQGTRQRSGASPGTYINTSIPVIPADRSAASLLSTFFPNGGLTSIDPVALALLNFKSNQFGGGGGGYLLPTVPGTAGSTNGQLNFGPLILSSVGKFSDDQFTTNWDREFRGGKDRLAFRFFWADSDTFQPFGGDSFQIQTGGAPTPITSNSLDIPLITGWAHHRNQSILQYDRERASIWGQHYQRQVE